MPLKDLLAHAAIRGAEIKIIPGIRMCEDCAFKKGTDANNDEDAVQAAGDCLAWGGNFNCHTDELGDAGIRCAGFQFAQQYFDSKQD